LAAHRDGDVIVLVMREPEYERLVLALVASAGLAANWEWDGQRKAQAILDIAHEISEWSEPLKA